MTPKEIADAIAAGIAAGNTVTNNLLFGIVAVSVIMLIVVLYLAFRIIALLVKFIMEMQERSTKANEQSGKTGQANTDAIAGQGKTLDKHTGALGSIDTNVKTALAVLDVLGVDVDTLAKHAVNPTAETKKEVEKIADESAEEKA